MPASRPDNEAIFHAARDIPDPDRRREYVREACGGDEARIAHVEALLAAADGPDSLLDRPAADITDATSDQPTTESSGRVIGPYKLIEPIGEGGMGSVWMAQQTEPVKRLVAVKLIQAGMHSRQIIARFEAERQALALMDHPNIARVLDGGTTSGGRPYFVMDLVKGVPITRYCDEHRLTPRQRLELFIPVCQAVQHAHQKGVIHRDLKPSNVLVALYDGKPVPKIIDFGIAKAAGQQLTDKTLVTGFGAIVGTLEYMSPEQAEVNQLDIDTRSDIYSLGVLLYELLTGSPPFSRKTLEKAGMLEMLRVIREQEPTKPSTKLSTAEGLPTLAANRGMEPARLTKLVRGELDWIVMKALEKDRNRRYETANGFAMDVQRYLADEPVSAGPPTASYRLRKFVRRNRARVTAAGLVLLALVLGVVGTTLGLIEARRQERQAAKRLAQVTKMNEILGSIFQDLNPASAQKEGKPLSAVLGEQLERATAEIEGEATGDPLAVARMQMILGRSQRGLGYPDRAIGLYTKARATFTAALGPDHPDTLNSMNGLAGSYYSVGQLDRAIKLYEETLALRRAKLGPDHPDTLNSMQGLALSYGSVGQLEQAIKLHEETLALQRAKLGLDHPLTLRSMLSLASSLSDADQRERALKLREQTLVLQRAKLGPEHPDTLVSMNNLAISYHIAGQPKQAMKLFEETLALQRSKLGPDHPDTLRSMHNLAKSYADSGQHERARKLSEETLAIQKTKLGRDHPETLSTMNLLASAYSAVGQHDRAINLHEETLALTRAKLGRDHSDTLISMHNVANNYSAVGEYDRALKLFEETLALMRAKLGPDHRYTVESLGGHAQCLANSGQLDRAGAILDEVIASQRKAGGDGHPDTLQSRLNRADLDLARGRLNAALAADRAILEECRSRLGADDRLTIAAGLALARIREARGDRDSAAPLYHAALESARKNPTDRETLATALTESGRSRLGARDWTGAEALLREALAIREAEVPQHWRTAEARSLLGGALLGQQKTAVAAPLLRSGYDAMAGAAAAIPLVDRPRLGEALDRLIAAGEAAGTNAEIAAWRAERAKLGAGGPKP